MIFVWSGWGAWIFGSLALTLGGAALYMKLADLPPSESTGPLLAAFFLAGFFCLLLGAHARQSAPRRVWERQTGRELMRRPVHSVYWLRAEYWGLVYFGIALWIWLARLR